MVRSEGDSRVLPIRYSPSPLLCYNASAALGAAMIPNAWTGLDFGLGHDVDMLRETVASVAQDRIAPRAAEIDPTHAFPRDLWPELGVLGLLGITVEEEFGGAGFGYL